MIRPDGHPILPAAAMRAAEDAACAGGVTVDTLMARAGRGVADAVRRLAGAAEVLVLCGPGNNGGDGYVAATLLRAAGVPVRVAAAGDPKTPAAVRAREGWPGSVEPLAEARAAPVLVDALFGTGLARPLEPATAAALGRLADAAQLRIAVDLPSGVGTDDGAAPGAPPRFDLSLALGALKPAHVLQPAARYAGTVRIVDIGVPVDGPATLLAAPALPQPGPDSHKYSRGVVTVVGGAMAGAGELAASAALHAGAGYVTLLGHTAGAPDALVRRAFSPDALADPRMGAVVVGPGLGRDDAARAKLAAAMASRRPLVVDGDALRLVDPDALRRHPAPIILTPHAGEFDGLFGPGPGGKIVRAAAAAARSGAVVVFKGADTVIAAPDGRVRVAAEGSPWLSAAGTGDVLAGAIGAMLAAGLDPLDAAAAGVWLHAAAARLLGAAFLADDLAAALSKVRA